MRKGTGNFLFTGKLKRPAKCRFCGKNLKRVSRDNDEKRCTNCCNEQNKLRLKKEKEIEIENRNKKGVEKV